MISIVMPSYNRQAYLAETINSILGQKYKDWELIIVDDGSSDDSRILYDYYTKKDPRIKVLYIKHGGIAKARNAGIKESKGEYIAVMDSDDLMHPDRLKKELKALKGDFVYSSYFIANEHAQIQAVHYPPSKVTLDDVRANGAWPHVTILAKKECFIQNPYREEANVNDDAFLVWDWFKEGYKGTWIKEPLVIVRVHSNTSKEKADEIAKTQLVLNKEYEDYTNNRK